MEAKAFLTTGIGSLPFRSVDEAVAHVLRSYDIPFFPQLPALCPSRVVAPMMAEVCTEAMLAALIARDAAALRTQMMSATASPVAASRVVRSQPALGAFVREVPGDLTIKLQVVGPVTLAALIVDRIGEGDRGDWLEISWCWIKQMTDAWIMTLRAYAHRPLLMVWDDVLMLQNPTPETAADFDDCHRRAARTGARLGIHSCAPVDVATVTEAFPHALLALDMNVTDFESEAARRAARRHMDRSGGFLFGAFDTRVARPELLKARRAAELARDIARGSDQVAIMTGGCGTGLKSETFELELVATMEICRTSAFE